MKKKRKLSISAMSVMTAALLSLAGAPALAAPMKPELAAKREMVRKQEEQRIKPEERKAATDWLKSERMKIYQARQAALKSGPGPKK
jgi:hypothetical protein